MLLIVNRQASDKLERSQPYGLDHTSLQVHESIQYMKLSFENTCETAQQ